MCLKFPEEASLLCFTEELFCGARDETEAVPTVVTVCEKFAVSLSKNTTTTTTRSLFQIKYSLQSLCPQLAKAIRGGYKRKKKIV